MAINFHTGIPESRSNLFVISLSIQAADPRTLGPTNGICANFNNPWAGRSNSAPFDHQFYFVFNVACGGTNGYFPDGVGNKPWSDTDPRSVNTFYNNRASWLPTWNGSNTALKIDYVRVWSFDSENQEE